MAQVTMAGLHEALRRVRPSTACRVWVEHAGGNEALVGMIAAGGMGISMRHGEWASHAMPCILPMIDGQSAEQMLVTFCMCQRELILTGMSSHWLLPCSGTKRLSACSSSWRAWLQNAMSCVRWPQPQRAQQQLPHSTSMHSAPWQGGLHRQDSLPAVLPGAQLQAQASCSLRAVHFRGCTPLAGPCVACTAVHRRCRLRSSRRRQLSRSSTPLSHSSRSRRRRRSRSSMLQKLLQA